MKKLFWIIGTSIVCVLYAFVVGIIFVIGNSIASIRTRSEIQSINQNAFNVVMILGWVILIVLSIWLYRRWRMKCHACTRWGALKLLQTELLKQENISVLMELEHRNTNREVTGTHDQYIPGKRNTYKNIYKCQYCGNLETSIYTKDMASI